MTLKYMTMNENIDLTKILKNCPRGTKLYSLVHGEVEFDHIETYCRHQYVIIELKDFLLERINFNGKLYNSYAGECILFPSKDQRDWSKFTAPWYKKEKFDPKTLKSFDRVLVRDEGKYWDCDLFSYISNRNIHYPYVTITNSYDFCIPYNDDTKHLVNTTDEAPEYYRYWED